MFCFWGKKSGLGKSGLTDNTRQIAGSEKFSVKLPGIEAKVIACLINRRS
jgi:hypothetical protein